MASTYLYGTRFATWLAYAYRRKNSSPGPAATKAANVTTLISSSTSSGSAATGLAELDTFEHEFQQRNLAEVRKFPIHPTRAGRERAGVGITHVCMKRRAFYMRPSESRCGRARRCLNTGTGAPEPADIKGAMNYRSRLCVRRRPAGTAFYADRQSAVHETWSVNVKTGVKRLLLCIAHASARSCFGRPFAARCAPHE
jgi:hypothetical protein